jgi:hypothetical protein
MHAYNICAGSVWTPLMYCTHEWTSAALHLSLSTPSLLGCKFISMHEPSISMQLLVSLKNKKHCIYMQTREKLNRTTVMLEYRTHTHSTIKKACIWMFLKRRPYTRQQCCAQLNQCSSGQNKGLVLSSLISVRFVYFIYLFFKRC